MWENTLAKCRCRKTRLRSYAHLVFLVFTEYPFYLFLGKRFFPLLSIKWLFGRNQNSFRKARLRNIFPRQYIASYKHPIRFYLREKKKKTSHGLFGFHKVMATFSCETTQKRYGNTLMVHVSSGLYSYFFSQFPWIERNLPLFDFDKIMKNLAHGWCFYGIASLLLTQLPWIERKLPLFGFHISTR